MSVGMSIAIPVAMSAGIPLDILTDATFDSSSPGDHSTPWQ
jgi:hypothetical protein